MTGRPFNQKTLAGSDCADKQCVMDELNAQVELVLGIAAELIVEVEKLKKLSSLHSSDRRLTVLHVGQSSGCIDNHAPPVLVAKST